MTVTDDYYATLDVAPTADDAVIREAYRALMRKYHPDVNTSEQAVARAKAINEAYACLRDPSRRAQYDWQRGLRTQHPMAAGVRPRRRPEQPDWTNPPAVGLHSRPDFKPTWGKAAGIGIAMLLTAITFTITSAIPPIDPAVAARAREARASVVAPVRMVADPAKGRPESGTQPCEDPDPRRPKPEKADCQP